MFIRFLYDNPTAVSHISKFTRQVEQVNLQKQGLKLKTEQKKILSSLENFFLLFHFNFTG